MTSRLVSNGPDLMIKLLLSIQFLFLMMSHGLSSAFLLGWIEINKKGIFYSFSSTQSDYIKIILSHFSLPNLDHSKIHPKIDII